MAVDDCGIVHVSHGRAREKGVKEVQKEHESVTVPASPPPTPLMTFYLQETPLQEASVYN